MALNRENIDRLKITHTTHEFLTCGIFSGLELYNKYENKIIMGFSKSFWILGP